MFEGNSLIGQISKGKFPTEKVSTKYGEFSIEYPSGEDIQVIARKKASFCGGLPLNSFSVADQFRFDIDATLSVVLKEYPKDFPTKWESDDIVSFPDQEVKNALFKAFNIFFGKTQKGLSGKS